MRHQASRGPGTILKLGGGGSGGGGQTSPEVRDAPRIFSRGGPEQTFSYIVASRVRNINLT